MLVRRYVGNYNILFQFLLLLIDKRERFIECELDVESESDIYIDELGFWAFKADTRLRQFHFNSSFLLNLHMRLHIKLCAKVNHSFKLFQVVFFYQLDLRS